MGHRKIEISRIQNDRHRQVTFAKRKLGVMKKATELAILCQANVAVIVFSANNKMSVFSNGPMNTLVQRFLETRESAEVVTTEDYFREKAREAMATADSDDGALHRLHAASADAWPITVTNVDGSFAYPSRPYALTMSQGFASQPHHGLPPLQPSPVEQSSQVLQRQMAELQQMQLLQQQIQHHQQELQHFQMQQVTQGQQRQQMALQPPQQAASQQSYLGFPQGQQAMMQVQGGQNQPMRAQQPLFQSFPPYVSELKPLSMADPEQLQLQLQQLQRQQRNVLEQLESAQRQQRLSPDVHLTEANMAAEMGQDRVISL